MAIFVLIPGAGGDPWFWSQLTPLLQAAGHHVVPVDLPGSDDAAGIEDYTRIAVSAFDAASSDEGGDVVVVGQSLGAFTAVRVCEERPVALLVLLNAMIPAPGESAGEWWENTQVTTARRRFDERRGSDPDRPFDVVDLFLHDVPEDVLATSSAPRAQSENVFASRWNATGWPNVPTRVVAGREDRFFPVEFQRDLAARRLGVDLDVIPGGHLAALSHPGELAQLLLGYVTSAP